MRGEGLGGVVPEVGGYEVVHRRVQRRPAVRYVRRSATISL